MGTRSFNMGLDEDTAGVVVELPAEEVKVEAPVEVKFAGDAIILPIPSIDAAGNPVTVCKNIEVVTADEFLKWMTVVLPFPDEAARRFMGLKKSGKGWDDMKNRIGVFNSIVRMHEQRWVFGQGKAEVDAATKSN